jgi:GMP synthase (glutamine-hydrolysing)
LPSAPITLTNGGLGLAYGLQCHMEFNRDVVELLIAHSEGELATLVDHKYVQQPDALRQNDYSQMNETLFVFVHKLAHEYEAQRRWRYRDQRPAARSNR